MHCDLFQVSVTDKDPGVWNEQDVWSVQAATKRCAEEAGIAWARRRVFEAATWTFKLHKPSYTVLDGLKALSLGKLPRKNASDDGLTVSRLRNCESY